MFKKLIFPIGLICLVVLCIPFYTNYQASPYVKNKVSELSPRTFAIVLGAGLKNGGKPGYYLRNRLDDAIKLYQSGKIRKILISGDNSTENYDEISAMNNYLLQKGIPQNIIFGDYAGFDTYSSMERADKIFDVRDAIIVTQDFHLKRSVYIAREKGIDAEGYASQVLYGERKYFPREWGASIKAFFDCLINRTPKFYGEKVDTTQGSNIEIEQL
uniref:SanA/YdcF family protein n=1 Tax=Ornithobacterium rhinotracheale TaxID=28251 RepID=UPI0039A6C077